MSGRVKGRFAATAALLLLAGALLPVPGEAYPETASGFLDGVSDVHLSFGAVPSRQFVGTFALPSNATVSAASVDIEPGAALLTVDATQDAAAGFPQGTASPFLTRAPGGLSLAEVGGSTEFSGAGFDAGSFAGTARVSASVVLTAPSGSYSTPAIAWNQVSYGRLIADISVPAGAAATISIVNATDAVLQSSLRPGDLITVDGNGQPSIRVKVALAESANFESPAIRLLGAGYVAADSNVNGPTAAWRSGTGLTWLGGSLQLNEDAFEFTPYAGNPIAGPAPGTWHSLGFDASSAITVGGEIWLYGGGINETGVEVIGRYVSSDGGYSFTPDADPLLLPSAEDWEDYGLVSPFVMRDGGMYKMWYGGSGEPFPNYDVYKIGYATSADGITWTRYAANPVFSNAPSGWDDYSVSWPHIVKVGGTYWMYYSGRLSTNALKSIGLATSSDGISWTRDANNPLILRGDTTWGAYEAAVSDVRYLDGVFYLYWTCAAAADDYDACASTSTDGVTFSHYAGNPVISNGQGAWDEKTAQGALWASDPATGRGILFYTGMTLSADRSLARADPKALTSGSYEATWDLSGEVPARFEAARIVVEEPAQTTAAASLSVSADNVSYSPLEPLSFSDTTLVTAPRAFTRIAVDLSTADPRVSPRLHSARLDYSRFAAGGIFTSAPMPVAFPLRDATLTLADSRPAGSQISLEISADNGSTWSVATSGVSGGFAAPGKVFRYRITLDGTSGAAPNVAQVQVHLTLSTRPTNVRLETGAGALLASDAGELSARKTVALDTASLNALIAPLASSDPPATVPVDLFANSTTPGLLTVSNLSLQLSFPDTLRAFFSPAGVALQIEEGTSQVFRVQASTSPGIAIHYAWSVDNVTVGADSAEFTFLAPRGAPGPFAVRAVASNGQFIRAHTWSVSVFVQPTASVNFFPQAANLTVPTGMTLAFAAVVSDDSPATIAWTLDTRSPTEGPSFTFVAPIIPGPHVLTVEVVQGANTVSRGWNITVVPTPGGPTGPFLISFAPGGDVVVHVNDAVMFWATLNEEAAPPVTYSWGVSEQLTGTADFGNFTLTASTPGNYGVWVVVRNETRYSTYLWNVTVLPVGAQGQQGGGSAGTLTGASVDPAPWIIAGAAVAAAAASSWMYVRLRARRPGP